MKIELKKQTGIPRRCEVLGCGKKAEYVFVFGGRQMAVCKECLSGIKSALKNIKEKDEDGVENAKK